VGEGNPISDAGKKLFAAVPPVEKAWLTFFGYRSLMLRG